MHTVTSGPACVRETGAHGDPQQSRLRSPCARRVARLTCTVPFSLVYTLHRCLRRHRRRCQLPFCCAEDAQGRTLLVVHLAGLNHKGNQEGARVHASAASMECSNPALRQVRASDTLPHSPSRLLVRSDQRQVLLCAVTLSHTFASWRAWALRACPPPPRRLCPHQLSSPCRLRP